ncbi:MAG TPA: T9SS type A sorting domain-containing protein [Candidatus Kapabacteria bacterium]|nr:T9SS type A sorting domain-containing protein [Candidatus Kapabacteria bacterium]
MKQSLLLGLTAAAFVAAAPLMAQRSAQAPRTDRSVPNEAQPYQSKAKAPAAPRPLSQATPPNLRSGAVYTGLHGFYDYQSNGVMHGRLMVSKSDPKQVYSVYMLSTDGTDTTSVQTSRRVGYAHSTDGGATWSSTTEIDPGFRLGFPWLAIAADGSPYITVHGDPDKQGNQVLVYTGSASSTTFTRTGKFERQSFTGRVGDQGNGVIWPSIVISPNDATKQVVTATLGPPAGEDDDPVHVARTPLGGNGPWDIVSDQPYSTSSGGRTVITTSAGGKIGMAYSHTDTTGSMPGIYYTESTDGGATWKDPVRVIDAESYPNETDTLGIRSNLDMAFLGEDPQIVVTGSINNLYRKQGILLWNSKNGIQKIVGADSTMGLGVITAVAAFAQPAMDYVSYPSISVGDDGKHMVVVFQAASMKHSYNSDSTAIDPFISGSGFHYFRIWAVGSPDGGNTWAKPQVIQDFVGDGTDTASIEYPVASEFGKMGPDRTFKLWTTFQARRQPGMYAFIVTDVGGGTPATRGPINETYQYFQRTSLPPTFFGEPAAVESGNNQGSSLKVTGGYPNPAGTTYTVNFELPTSGDATLTVYDMLGTAVSARSLDMNYAGSYSRAVDVSALPSGHYRVVISQNGHTASQPFSVVR